jgi:hypothetical protein
VVTTRPYAEVPVSVYVVVVVGATTRDPLVATLPTPLMLTFCTFSVLHDSVVEAPLVMFAGEAAIVAAGSAYTVPCRPCRN